MELSSGSDLEEEGECQAGFCSPVCSLLAGLGGPWASMAALQQTLPMLAVGFGAGSQEHEDHYLLGTINAVFVTLRWWAVLFLPKKSLFQRSSTTPGTLVGPATPPKCHWLGLELSPVDFSSALPVLFLAEKVEVCLMQSNPAAPLSPSWRDYLRTRLAGGETLLSEVCNSKRKVPTRVAPFLPTPPPAAASPDLPAGFLGPLPLLRVCVSY